jgi:hypothetical protein
MASGERPPWQVDLAVPPWWFTLTCDPDIDSVQVPEQVDERINREPALQPFRQGMIDSLMQWSASAKGLGAELAAMRWDQDDTFGMGVATLMVTRLMRDPGPPDDELNRLRPMLAEVLPSDEYPPRITDVTLGVGEGLRMEAVRQPPDVDGHNQPLRLVVEYWIPVEDVDLIQMSFGTNNLALAADMSEEFELIARNLGYDTTPV